MFGEIRTMTDENGEPWFVGKDVAEALGYANPQKLYATTLTRRIKGGTNRSPPPEEHRRLSSSTKSLRKLASCPSSTTLDEKHPTMSWSLSTPLS
ncbi:MAG: Bro-N domain-containing protein [Prevotella sp.]|nr:Bro-N domain-containing protein [Prevotella sp.]